MKHISLILFLLISSASVADETVATLGAEFWFMPRDGNVVAANPGVQAAVRELIGEPDAYLVLRHPQTESGELWGQELRAWLVSLGLVSDRIELQASADLLEAVEVVLIGATLEQSQVPLQIDTLNHTGSGATELETARPDVGFSEAAEVTVNPAETDVQKEVELK